MTDHNYRNKITNVPCKCAQLFPADCSCCNQKPRIFSYSTNTTICVKLLLLSLIKFWVKLTAGVSPFSRQKSKR